MRSKGVAVAHGLRGVECRVVQNLEQAQTVSLSRDSSHSVSFSWLCLTLSLSLFSFFLFIFFRLPAPPSHPKEKKRRGLLIGFYRLRIVEILGFFLNFLRLLFASEHNPILEDAHLLSHMAHHCCPLCTMCTMDNY